jgi:hypothetical protein
LGKGFFKAIVVFPISKRGHDDAVAFLHRLAVEDLGAAFPIGQPARLGSAHIEL